MTRIDTTDYPDGRWRWRATDETTGLVIGRGGNSYETQAGALGEFYRLTDGPYTFANGAGVDLYNADLAEGHHEHTANGCLICDQTELPL